MLEERTTLLRDEAAWQRREADEARDAARAAMSDGSQALARREVEVATLRGMLLIADADVAALGEFHGHQP